MKPIYLLPLAVLLAGCHTDMWTQPKVTQYDEDETGLFADGTTARPLVPGTVPRGWARQDEAKSTGYEGAKFTKKFPTSLVLDGEEVNTTTEPMKVLKWGKERFEVVCLNCHGAAGDGKGMITQRGLVLTRPPATFHTERLRNMPVGYFYDVITNGYGVMYSHASRLEPDERWAVIAYLRALQLAHGVPADQLDAKDRENMEAQNKPTTTDESHGGGH